MSDLSYVPAAVTRLDARTPTKASDADVTAVVTDTITAVKADLTAAKAAAGKAGTKADADWSTAVASIRAELGAKRRDNCDVRSAKAASQQTFFAAYAAWCRGQLAELLPTAAEDKPDPIIGVRLDWTIGIDGLCVASARDIGGAAAEIAALAADKSKVGGGKAVTK